MKEEFDKLCAELENQYAKIGEENIKNYRMCPICLNYVKRIDYNNHACMQGYETLVVMPNRR